MADEPRNTLEVLRTAWSAEGEVDEDLADVIGQKKCCKNMKGVSFDGMAEPGSDLRAAWRERLAREGKLRPSGSSVRDLVFGAASDQVPPAR